MSKLRWGKIAHSALNLQTRIRVRFADRSQLEGVLPSTDKLIAIYEFVKLALAEEHRAKPFLLCASLRFSLLAFFVPR